MKARLHKAVRCLKQIHWYLLMQTIDLEKSLYIKGSQNEHICIKTVLLTKKI